MKRLSIVLLGVLSALGACTSVPQITVPQVEYRSVMKYCHFETLPPVLLDIPVDPKTPAATVFNMSLSTIVKLEFRVQELNKEIQTCQNTTP